MIMSSEAAARPQKVQKRRHMAHRIDKARRESKVSTTRLKGVFGRVGDDLGGRLRAALQARLDYEVEWRLGGTP
jgi:hypothetical protein